ncbi:MAG: XTP/dITP diphosphatase [Polyangia bacterium]
MKRLLFATRNGGKLRELAELVAPLGIAVVSIAELERSGVAIPEVEEDAPSFAGNAEKKARSALAATGLAALADDSGLEVDALGGAPGVYSARYAGLDHDDGANNAKLLAALVAVFDPDRTARFRCALALAVPGGELVTAEGSCEGRIARAARGAGGFGYDPLFLVGAGDRTMAELAPEEKNRISHRGQAMRALALVLASRPTLL